MPAKSRLHVPEKAFILAAGFGTRMRPLTDTVPKPLAQVAGRTLLARTLDQLEQEGVQEVVINTHYLAEKITSHLASRSSPRITFSHEDVLLNTGGGIKNALRHFNEDPFFVLSGDGLWTDGPDKMALHRLAEAWNPDTMDILMLLQPLSTFTLTKGAGDYDLDNDGRATRSRKQTGQYMFTSIRINHPRIFKNTPEGPFSYLDLMDAAEKAGRLFGLVHNGEWHHISTMSDLAAADESFRKRGL